MSTAGPASPSAPPETPTPVRRAFRSSDDAYLGGVAGGLAEHLGIDPMLVRLAFVVTGLFGLGILFYGGLWLVLPMAPAETVRSPGIDAATRQGKRPTSRRTLRDAGPVVALGALVLGVAGLVDLVLGGPLLVWPVLLALLGLMVLWRQADEAQRARWADRPGVLNLRRVVLGDGGVAAWARLATGLGMLVAALLIFALQSGRVAVARDVVVAGLLGMLGLALTLGPWLARLVTDLTTERAARVRSQERADVAAHLHDSVLQTLALIQKNAADPGQVSRLARAQERDLREWMYGEPAQATTLSSALRAAAAEVEDSHDVAVQVVTVGDVNTTDDLQALVQAAREAIVNAAKHAGTEQVDVYAEVDAREASVFVRDRGRGFEPDLVPAGRMGLRNSIRDRMARHGGVAEVRSRAGEGTEVRLRMPLTMPPEGAR